MLLDIIDFDKLKRGAMHMIYMLVAIGVQGQVFSRVAILGVRPMFIPAAVVAVGMLEGGGYGGLIGLFAGIFADISFQENTIMFTVLFPLIGMFSGVFAENYINKRFFSYLFMSLGAFLITAAAQLFGLLMFAGANAVDLTVTAVLQTLWSLPLAAIIYFPYRALAEKGKSRIK